MTQAQTKGRKRSQRGIGTLSRCHLYYKRGGRQGKGVQGEHPGRVTANEFTATPHDGEQSSRDRWENIQKRGQRRYEQGEARENLLVVRRADRTHSKSVISKKRGGKKPDTVQRKGLGLGEKSEGAANKKIPNIRCVRACRKKRGN